MTREFLSWHDTQIQQAVFQPIYTATTAAAIGCLS